MKWREGEGTGYMDIGYELERVRELDIWILDMKWRERELDIWI